MKKNIYVILVFLISACASTRNKELLLGEWDKIEPLLIAEAKKIMIARGV